jgi:hypothetical protein
MTASRNTSSSSLSGTNPPSNSLPTPKISRADLHDASPTVNLPRLSKWDDILASQPDLRFGLYEWLGDACLNLSVLYFPDLSPIETKGFATIYKTAEGHRIFVERCYIDNDKQTMRELIETNTRDVTKKSYSDYLEVYVGILLKSSGLDGDKVWEAIKGIVTVGLLYHMSQDENSIADDRGKLRQDNTLPPIINSSYPEISDLSPRSCNATTSSGTSIPSKGVVL